MGSAITPPSRRIIWLIALWQRNQLRSRAHIVALPSAVHHLKACHQIALPVITS